MIPRAPQLGPPQLGRVWALGSISIASVLACGEPSPARTDGEGTESGESGAATESSATTESSDTATTGADDYDCANLPVPEVYQLSGPIGAADVSFDDQGNLIGSNTEDIFKTFNASGPPSLWVPSIPGRAAIRQLSDGRVAVTQEIFFRVLVFTPDGSSDMLASNLVYPFGLIEDLDHNVYIGDDTRIVRVDLDSGETEVWLDTPDFVSRWMSFDRDYDGMFIGGMTKTIYRVPISPSGEAGAPVEWGYLPTPEPPPVPLPPDPSSTVHAPGQDTGGGVIDNGETGGDDTGGDEDPGLIDGLGVDACGNVYVAEFHSRGLYRIPVGGGEGELLVDWGEIRYGHGLQWGSGIGDWSATSLFLPQPYNNHNVTEVDIGVPSKQ